MPLDVTILTLTCLLGEHKPLLTSVHEEPDDPQVSTETYLQIQNRSDAGFKKCLIYIQLYISGALLMLMLDYKL